MKSDMGFNENAGWSKHIGELKSVYESVVRMNKIAWQMTGNTNRFNMDDFIQRDVEERFVISR